MDSRAKELCSISGNMFSKKSGYDRFCQSVADVFYPIRSDFTQKFPMGDDFAGTLSDGYTTLAREQLGNSIDSMLRQGKYFTISTGDEAIDKKPKNAAAMEMATRTLASIIQHPYSNAEPAVKEMDMDWVALGGGVMSWEESSTRQNLITRTWHPRDCAYAFNEDGRLDVMHRKCKFTARDIHRKFTSKRWNGTESTDIKNAAENEPFKEFEIVHIMMPTEEAYGSDGAKMRQIRHPFLSLYLDIAGGNILNERGARVFNYIAPRWRTISGFTYPFSPAAMNALPDGRMLQDMARVIIEQAEKAVDPPMVGSSEIFTRDINMYASGFTSVDLPEDARLQDKMTTIESHGGISVGMEMKRDVRELIAESFLLNKLYLPNVREMTAFEAGVRTEEFRRAALPFFTPIQSQYFSPWLSTAFNMSVNMGIIRAEMFPEELQDRDINFRFNSPLQEAEGRKQVIAYQESMQILAAGSQVDQTIASIFNAKEATFDALRGTSAPMSWFVVGEERKKKDAADAEKKALMEQAQALREGASVAADVSSATMAAQQAGLMPAGA